MVVSNGPTPSKSPPGLSVFMSGGREGLVPPIGGRPGNPGNPGCSPDPPMLGGGSPIPPIKSEAGLSVWFSVEPGSGSGTPIPVGGRPASPLSISVLGGIVAGETKSSSFSSSPSILGFCPPGGSPILKSSSFPFPGPEGLSSPGLNGKRLSSVGFTGMGMTVPSSTSSGCCPPIPKGLISNLFLLIWVKNC